MSGATKAPREKKRTPRAKVHAEAPAPYLVESDATTPVQGVAPTRMPAPVFLSPLEMAAQKVMQASLNGVPAMITYGRVTPRASNATPPHLASWVGLLQTKFTPKGRPIMGPIAWLALQQETPIPSGPEFQNYGADHENKTWGGSRLKKGFTITVDEAQSGDALHWSPDHLAFQLEVEQRLLNRDLFLVSFDRLRLYSTSNSGFPVSDPIILEAYDTNGDLVWTNPRIPFVKAVAACGVGMPTKTIVPKTYPNALEAGGNSPIVAAPEPQSAPTPSLELPNWFSRLQVKAAKLGVTNLGLYIVGERSDFLLENGVADNEAAAKTMAEMQVGPLLAQIGAPAPAPTHAPAPARQSTQEPASAEAVASAIGIKIQAAATVSPHAKKVKEPAASAKPLPAVLTLDHLGSKQHREAILTRIIDFLASCPDKKASTGDIRTHLGLPLGSGGDLQAVGTAVKRMMARLTNAGLVEAEGATRDRLYRLTK